MSDEQWGLVMPFVTVASKGGPHDDESFTVGFVCGGLDAELRLTRPARLETTVRSVALPQIDLIAMREGYTMTAEPWEEHPEEWTFVVLEQGTAVGGEGSKGDFSAT